MTITIQHSVESLSLPQLKQEVSDRFQKREVIHKEAKARGFMNDEEKTEWKRIGDEMDVFEDVISKRESSAQMFQRHEDMRAKYGQPAQPMIHADTSEVAGKGRNERKSLGQLVAESVEYKDAIKRGLISESSMQGVVSSRFDASLIEQRMERRALITGASDTSGGAFVTPDYVPGYTDLRQRQLTLLDLISRIPTESDLISFVRQTGFTNSAAAVAEATGITGTTGLKPESGIALEVVTKPVETIAHWVPITTRALADVRQMRTIIDGQLMLGIDLALENLIITGNGTTPNLEGILTNASVLTQALGSDTMLDALFKALVKVQVTGLAMPNAYVLNPLNWQTIRLSRENASTGTLGGYLFGPPSMAGASTLWGLPVVLSIGMTANTGVVADWSMSTMALYDREQTVIRTGYVDDDFIRNVLRILAEMRAAFALFRPTAVCKVTGLT